MIYSSLAIGVANFHITGHLQCTDSEFEARVNVIRASTTRNSGASGGNFQLLPPGSSPFDDQPSPLAAEGFLSREAHPCYMPLSHHIFVTGDRRSRLEFLVQQEQGLIAVEAIFATPVAPSPTSGLTFPNGVSLCPCVRAHGTSEPS